MNIEELVKMPEPYRTLDSHLSHPVLRKVLFEPGDYFTVDQLRAYGEAVAAAVAKRCIALVIAEDVAPSDFAPGVQECIANAIRREFGEAGNG